MKTERFNSIRTRDDSEWLARISKARAERRAKGLDDSGLGWDEIIKAERREREILVAALWEQFIEQRKHLLTKIQVQIVRSGLKLIALARNRENALPMMGYRRIEINILGSKYAEDLTIPLPDAGAVKIRMLRERRGDAISISVGPLTDTRGKTLTGVKVQLYVDDVPEGSPEPIPNGGVFTFTSLSAGSTYRIHLFGEENKTWEIPLEVEEIP